MSSSSAGPQKTAPTLEHVHDAAKQPVLYFKAHFALPLELSPVSCSAVGEVLSMSPRSTQRHCVRYRDAPKPI